ncbi:glucitol operon activator protein GutM [Neobacillus bataviensis]|jgi:DNA-binding transcriptional regulator of glucitol operon|uniref:Glucitol operon activator protein GutM n=1 Tax=Neobacillus bataviensis TaxID=220685 RepID=A0A561D7P4_9BACI|nr:transcriptional regulator GutM [Neobacillus bataviensis]TWD99441.1 glucitol operon activator protein GutM [Neobacillus bataviensis]
MQIFIIMIFMAGAFIFQMVLGYLQIKHFSKAYAELRRIGKVAIGKKPGKIRSGTIVMFAVTNSGKILKAKKIQGVTVMAKVKDLHGFEDKNIRTLEEKDLTQCNKLLKLAILDAVQNYKVIMSGGEIPEKNSLFKRMMLQAERVAAVKK